MPQETRSTSPDNMYTKRGEGSRPGFSIFGKNDPAHRFAGQALLEAWSYRDRFVVSILQFSMPRWIFPRDPFERLNSVFVRIFGTFVKHLTTTMPFGR
jgi:hypothetical protein